MKVLQINAVYGYGSTGVIMRDIGAALALGGHDAYFAYQRTNQPVPNGYRIGNILDWKAHALMCRLAGRQGFHSAMATKAFLRQMDHIQPDVVHVHNLHSNYIHIELLCRYLAEHNIPTVATLHDCWNFTGKCFHYVDCGCEKFKTGCGSCIQQTAPPRSYFVDTSAKDYEAKKRAWLSIPNLTLVGCSQWICNEARKSFLRDCRIEQIYNGVDTQIFRPWETSDLRQQYGIGQDEFIVMGMANKWLTEKDIQLIPLILKEIPASRLMIVGCTLAQQQQLSSYGNRVVSIGFIHDRSELARHYSLANVFVNVTHADTLPTVNMESICCGTPVITYDACGSPELIDESTGFVVKEGDANEIVNAVQCTRYLARQTCANTGQMKFNKEISCRRHIDLYTKVVLNP